MVFSSHLFIFLFLPLTLLVYYLSPKKFRPLLLTLLSYFFYGWANPLFVLLMLTSTAIDYGCGLVIHRQIQGLDENSLFAGKKKRIKRVTLKKLALIVSITANLSMLGFFKYFNLLVESYNGLISLMGMPENAIDLAFKVVLPLGISFYTFQSMSYSIDIYRKQAPVMKNFVNFACYVSLFPQLVAGPIIRYSELADQLEERTHTREKFVRGFAFLALGLAKKVLLANPCGKIADLAFGAEGIPFYTAWYGIAAYAFQIYYDFSGYSDMAIGLGLMLGFVFPKNFDSPYHSRSITEFWRRWHLSLSFWLRDYLYIPLGGNKKGNVRTYLNLAAVMLLGGLWHGASWTFVIWGGFHGLLLVIERFNGKKTHYHFLPDKAKVALTFVLILFSWVFFRADNLTEALHYFKSLFGFGTSGTLGHLMDSLLYNPYYILSFIISAVVVWLGKQTWEWTRVIDKKKALIIAALFLVSLVILTTQDFNPFIYFIF